MDGVPVTIDAFWLITGAALLMVFAVVAGCWAHVASADTDRVQARLDTVSEEWRTAIHDRDAARTDASAAAARLEIERRHVRRLEDRVGELGQDLVSARALLDAIVGRPLQPNDATAFTEIVRRWEES